jgi:hypothetical protein
VFPQLSFDHLLNGVFVHPITTSEFRARRAYLLAFPTNGDHVSFCQSSRWMGTSLWRPVSALGVPIGVVDLSRPQEQVSRVAAKTVVTPMADNYTFRNRANVQYERVPMRSDVAAFAPECAVTAAVLTSNPVPAPSWIGSVKRSVKANVIGIMARVGAMPSATWANVAILGTHFLNLLSRFGGCRARGGSSRARVFACLNYTPIRHEMGASA